MKRDSSEEGALFCLSHYVFSVVSLTSVTSGSSYYSYLILYILIIRVKDFSYSPTDMCTHFQNPQQGVHCHLYKSQPF